MLKNQWMIAIIALCAIFATPFVMAAVTLNVPVAGTNYTTLTFNCTQASGDVSLARNATIFYNASGGPAGTSLGSITNDTADDTEFTESISIESLSDGTSYNFTCMLDNGTTQTTSAGKANVGIDNTNPVLTFTLLKTRLNTNRIQEITWTSTDATSGLSSTTLTVTSPNTDECATVTDSSSSATSFQITETGCTGTWNASLSATDDAGNTVTTSSTFKVEDAGFTGSAAATASGDGDVPTGIFSIFGKGTDGKANTKVIAIVILIILLFFVFKKK